MLIREQVITLGDLRAADARGNTREIISGQWAEPEGGTMGGGKRNGRIGAALIRLIANHVVAHDLGEVYQDQTTYVLQLQDNVVERTVIPDVSFVSKARVVTAHPDDYYFQAPDLAIEIVSPSERTLDTFAKINDYLEAGTQQVWLVIPKSKQIIVRTQTDIDVYGIDDILPGGDTLPGFNMALIDVFKD